MQWYTQTMPINIPSHLSDEDLVKGFKQYARHERAASAELIAHLVELETRELHLAAGFRSLFAYCCEELRLSEDAASTGSKQHEPRGAFPQSSTCSLKVRSASPLHASWVDPDERQPARGPGGRERPEQTRRRR